MIRPSALSTRASDGAAASLGVLSVHLSGERCRVGCEFCYLGARQGGAGALDLPLLEECVERLAWDELAVAVSDADEARSPVLPRLFALAERRRRPLSITTTCALAQAHPELARLASRLSLSVDPRKGPVDPAPLAALATLLHERRPTLEVVLIVSLTTAEFAARLIDGGLLAALVDLEAVDKVALNGLKPPPPFCDRAFWLAACARLAPLLARALDRRLFLDCYVAARILGLGGCPARADLSPAPSGLAFRGCVYQPAAEWVGDSARALAEKLADFEPPTTCPFEIK